MQPQDSFYKMLLQQPLFQGLGLNDLTEIVSKVKMHFQKFSDGSVIRLETDPCHNLLFLLKGNLRVSHASTNNRVVFAEQLKTPAVVGAENIFGVSQYHNRTYMAETDIQTLTISKESVSQIMLNYDVFRFNMLNLLSTRLQRADKALWETPSASLTRRFLQVCQHNFTLPSGRKEIIGKMVDLAVYIDATRLNLSRVLNSLKKNGLIELERKRVVIPKLESLVHFVQEHDN